jgi:hypothetical protein
MQASMAEKVGSDQHAAAGGAAQHFPTYGKCYCFVDLLFRDLLNSYTYIIQRNAITYRKCPTSLFHRLVSCSILGGVPRQQLEGSRAKARRLPLAEQLTSAEGAARPRHHAGKQRGEGEGEGEAEGGWRYRTYHRKHRSSTTSHSTNSITLITITTISNSTNSSGTRADSQQQRDRSAQSERIGVQPPFLRFRRGEQRVQQCTYNSSSNHACATYHTYRTTHASRRRTSHRRSNSLHTRTARSPNSKPHRCGCTKPRGDSHSSCFRSPSTCNYRDSHCER